MLRFFARNIYKPNYYGTLIRTRTPRDQIYLMKYGINIFESDEFDAGTGGRNGCQLGSMGRREVEIMGGRFKWKYHQSLAIINFCYTKFLV